MLGEPQFARVEDDFYPTPPENLDCLAALVDLSPYIVWEPACGEGHLSKRLQRYATGVISTDLIDRGYGRGGIDFLKAGRMAGAANAIVTNPPFDDMAEQFIRQALQLTEPVDGMVAMFLRNEYDCSKGRMDLFRLHPYAGKIIVTKRPRWIEGSKGSPRHSYSWYIWNWRRPQGQDPFVKLIHPEEARVACH